MGDEPSGPTSLFEPAPRDQVNIQFLPAIKAVVQGALQCFPNLQMVEVVNESSTKIQAKELMLYPGCCLNNNLLGCCKNNGHRYKHLNNLDTNTQKNACLVEKLQDILKAHLDKNTGKGKC